MFLTWETRNVSFPGLNESKYVGMCVYNVVIFAVVLTLIQSFTFAEEIDTRFAISAGGITLCTTTILLLTFVPKVIIPDYFRENMAFVLHLLLFITRKCIIINAKLKLIGAKIHSFHSFDIH